MTLRSLVIGLASRDKLAVSNLSTLYVSLAINGVVSLVTIAYLARVLEPRVWGIVLLAQAFGHWAALIPEYGFTYSATRDIARSPDAADRASIARSVFSAKALLCLLLAPVAAAAWFLVPDFKLEPIFLVGAVTFALAQGFDCLWLFQGVERHFIYAIGASVSRVLTLGAVFLLVKGPEDGSLVMFIQAGGAALIALMGVAFMARHFPRATPREKANTREALRAGWKLFQYRGAQSLTLNSGVVLLGIVSPASVIAFGSADRIMRNCVGLLGPIASAGLPRIARLTGPDPAAAKRVAHFSLAVTFAFGFIAGLLMFVFAPLIVRLLLGQGYEFVVPILRIAAVALPLAAASIMLAIQRLMPLGLEGPLVKMTFAAGLLNIAGCLVLGYFFGAAGAAWTVVAVETVLVISFLGLLRRRGESVTVR